MGETLTRPGHYWDFRECAWVRYTPDPIVPAQSESGDDQVVTAEEADVRSG